MRYTVNVPLRAYTVVNVEFDSDLTVAELRQLDNDELTNVIGIPLAECYGDSMLSLADFEADFETAVREELEVIDEVPGDAVPRNPSHGGDDRG